MLIEQHDATLPSSTTKGKKLRRWKACPPCSIMRRFWSISALMIAAIVLVFFATGASIWTVNYYIAGAAVSKIALTGQNFLIKRVIDYLAWHFSIGSFPLLTLQKEIMLGDYYSVNVSDPNSSYGHEVLISLLASYMKYSNLDGLAYVSKEDSFTGLYRTTPGDAKVQNYELVTARNRTKKVQSIDLNNSTLGAAQESIWNSTATSFGWYQQVEAKRDFVFFGPETSLWSHNLYIIVALPYFNHNNRTLLEGAIAEYIDVSSMTIYLRTMPYISGSRFLILNSRFQIIASNVVSKNQNITTLQNALNHTDNTIRETAQEIDRRYITSIRESIEENIQFTYTTSSGSVMTVVLETFPILSGNDLILILVTPQSEILKSLYTARSLSLSIAGAALAIAILVAIVFSCFVTRPLQLASKQMKRIANMDFIEKKKIRTLGLYEISDIANSLEQMKVGLAHFELYVPADVVRALVSQKTTAELNVLPRNMTIMFVELKSNDNTFNNLEPEILVDILMQYFTSLTDIIAEENGVIDKFMCESIMALFNAPIPVEDHAIKAVTAIARIQQKMAELNHMWKEKNYPEFYIIAGINSSNCLVGNIGCTDRISYTALGDGVNVASRLKELNTKFKTRIIIGPETYEAIKEKFLCRWLSESRLRGRAQPIDIYELVLDCEEISQENVWICVYHNIMKNALEVNDLVSARICCEELLQMDRDNVAALEIYRNLN